MPEPEGLLPYVLSLVVCDQIYVEPTIGKRSLLGLFSSLGTDTFPCTLPRMGVYLALTGGRGKTPIKVVIVDADEEREPLAVIETTLDFTDPIMVFEGFFDFATIQFPEPGEYRVQAFSHGSLLIERRIVMIKLEAQQ